MEFLGRQMRTEWVVKGERQIEGLVLVQPQSLGHDFPLGTYVKIGKAEGK